MPENWERKIEGIQQAANFHGIESFILLFQNYKESEPLPQNISSLNNIKAAVGLELLMFGLVDLIDKDMEQNKNMPKYIKIMSGLKADLKGVISKTNKKLDSLRKET